MRPECKEQEKKGSLEKGISCCHTLKVLRRAGIEDMAQLSRMSYPDLLELRGVGPVIAGGILKAVEEWTESAERAE